jgi:hypothetical protein
MKPRRNKRMNDAGKILGGLVVFLFLVTSPMWYNLATGKGKAGPDPVIAPEAGTECVANTEYMREYHMDLLNQWRDDVVRRADRVWVSQDGTEYDKSLSLTCMNCHHNKAEFCDRCHDYAAVNPYCWDCHVAPTEDQ